MLSYKSHVLKNSNFDANTCSMIISVVPRKNGLLYCSHCGNAAPQYDTLESRDFEFMPYCGMHVVFRYAMRRVSCPHCKHVYVEQVPWGDGKSPVTNEYKAVLAEEAKSNDTQTVAERYDATWLEVDTAVRDAVEYGLQTRELNNVTQIGIDEIAWKSGHDYITLVYQLNGLRRRLLWIGKDRTKQTMEDFFDDMEKEQPGFAKQLEVVCTDMWKPYTDVIAERAPQAVNILDRFHIVKMTNEAVDQVRNEEYKELKKTSPKTLERTKYCFLKNPEHLTSRQSLKLEELKKMNLKTNNAYLLKEQLRLMWTNCRSEGTARAFLEQWIKTAMHSTLEPIKKVARTIRRKLELILNYFKIQTPPTSGIVEGLNRMVNLVIRKSFGFRCFETAKAYLLHQLGDLAPLPFTHRFC